MRQLFAGLAITSLTLGAMFASTVRLKADPTELQADPTELKAAPRVSHSHHPPADVAILISGKPQPQYAYQGRVYVEAIKGREYQIRLRNPYPVRVAVALSVDGLNTIDAQRTTAAQARKWVLGPHETITISGWQVSSTHARKFEFTTEEKSYATALGKGDNLGVISAVFFRESVPAYTSAAPSAAPAPSLAGESMSESVQSRQADQEYAATGMGGRTGHTVTFINMTLEKAPAQTIDIRYEYREQLLRLGVLPQVVMFDPLTRRERSRGFDAGFSPEIPTR